LPMTSRRCSPNLVLKDLSNISNIERTTSIAWDAVSGSDWMRCRDNDLGSEIKAIVIFPTPAIVNPDEGPLLQTSKFSLSPSRRRVLIPPGYLHPGKGSH
jgi:hypothetical protein